MRILIYTNNKEQFLEQNQEQLNNLDELYGVKNNIERKEIVEKMLIYVEAMEKRSERPHSFLMHTQGLFYAQKGSKFWKRLINDPKADSNTLKEILKLLS